MGRGLQRLNLRYTGNPCGRAENAMVMTLSTSVGTVILIDYVYHYGACTVAAAAATTTSTPTTDNCCYIRLQRRLKLLLLPLLQQRQQQQQERLQE